MKLYYRKNNNQSTLGLGLIHKVGKAFLKLFAQHHNLLRLDFILF